MFQCTSKTTPFLDLMKKKKKKEKRLEKMVSAFKTRHANKSVFIMLTILTTR